MKIYRSYEFHVRKASRESNDSRKTERERHKRWDVNGSDEMQTLQTN